MTQAYRVLLQVSWYALLVAVPVTSFPLVARFAGGSQVSPLAGIPLLLLVLAWLIPRVLTARRLPRLSLPVVIFVFIAVVSIGASIFIEMQPFLDQSPLQRSIRALVTLLVGVSFYLVTAMFPASKEQLRKSLRWLYFGAFLALIWSSMQTVYVLNNVRMIVHNPEEVPSWMNVIHRIFSTRSMFSRRVTGLAFEPSWLADQLVILYLPLWLASVVQSTSVFSLKRSFVTVELGLFLWGSAILFMTQSRIGLLSFLAMISVVGFRIVRGIERRIIAALVQRRISRNDGEVDARQIRSWRILLWSFFIILVLTAVVVAALILVQFDLRYERMIEHWFDDEYLQTESSVYVLTNKLAYAERLIYWDVGFRTFAQYPILGVGLGNEGFFFLRNVPVYGSRLPEIISILNGWAAFPNTKSLWIRLLAETGVIGFLSFIIWLIMHAGAAKWLQKIGGGILSIFGAAALLGLLAQVFEGFSLDTFALPQLWILLGFVSAALNVSRRNGEAGAT